MISKRQARGGIKVRSSKELPLEDQDEGRVIECSASADRVLVRWDSGCDSWTTRDALFPLEAGK